MNSIHSEFTLQYITLTDYYIVKDTLVMTTPEIIAIE